MKTLNILVCEGNTPEEGKKFKDVGIATHTESLKESLNYYYKNLNILPDFAKDIKLTSKGLNHSFYKKKDTQFNSPAFNFDEVVSMPNGAIHLASNKINKIQSLYFKSGISEVWGLQYHPEITYEKMISIIKFRKERLINERKRFKNEDEVKNHINLIEEEVKVSNKDSRMIELKNWLDYLLN